MRNVPESLVHVGFLDLPADQVVPATVTRHRRLKFSVHLARALVSCSIFYHFRMCHSTPLLSDLIHEGLRLFPVRRSGNDEHLLRVFVLFGATLFPEGTAQRLQMIEELLVPSHVVQSAGGEAFVQDSDEPVRVPRVHGTGPQPSRGDPRMILPICWHKPFSSSTAGSSASTPWNAVSFQPFTWRPSFWNSSLSLSLHRTLFR